MKRLIAVAATASLLALPATAQHERTMLSIISTPDTQIELMVMVLTLRTTGQGVAPVSFYVDPPMVLP